MALKKETTIRKPRVHRDCHSQKPLHIPNATTSLRTILDRTGAGLPVNARVAKHFPLPPDGDDMNDFEKGTEEYLDLVDVQQLDERIKAEQQKKYEEQQKKREEEKQKELDNIVSQRVAEELAKSSAPIQQ